MPEPCFPFADCPFYGFRWPDRSDTLVTSGGNECGLEFETGKPCSMEAGGRQVNFHLCPVAASMRPMLESARNHIRFRVTEADPPTSLSEWLFNNPEPYR